MVLGATVQLQVQRTDKESACQCQRHVFNGRHLGERIVEGVEFGLQQLLVDLRHVLRLEGTKLAGEAFVVAVNNLAKKILGAFAGDGLCSAAQRRRHGDRLQWRVVVDLVHR